MCYWVLPLLSHMLLNMSIFQAEAQMAGVITKGEAREGLGWQLV